MGGAGVVGGVVGAAETKSKVGLESTIHQVYLIDEINVINDINE